MHLFIMRHGIAVDHAAWNGSDFDRPLTPEGLQRTHQMLAKLSINHELAVDAIWSSPLLRAKQTAEIASKILNLPVKLVDQLECGAHLASLMRAAEKHTLPERLLTTGHEPDCGHLVGELTADNLDHPFKRAGIAHLKGDFKPGGMKLIWHYAPKDFGG